MLNETLGGEVSIAMVKFCIHSFSRYFSQEIVRKEKKNHLSSFLNTADNLQQTLVCLQKKIFTSSSKSFEMYGAFLWMASKVVHTKLDIWILNLVVCVT